MQLSEFAGILQASVSPAIIISACGLLMLSMTNRYGRAIDRARSLVRERTHADAELIRIIDAQLSILKVRSKLIKSAILCASICILLSALEVLTLFLGALFKVHSVFVFAILFAASLGSLCLAMVYFIRDIFRSLEAMEADIDQRGLKAQVPSAS